MLWLVFLIYSMDYEERLKLFGRARDQDEVVIGDGHESGVAQLQLAEMLAAKRLERLKGNQSLDQREAEQ